MLADDTSSVTLQASFRVVTEPQEDVGGRRLVCPERQGQRCIDCFWRVGKRGTCWKEEGKVYVDHVVSLAGNLAATLNGCKDVCRRNEGTFETVETVWRRTCECSDRQDERWAERGISEQTSAADNHVRPRFAAWCRCEGVEADDLRVCRVSRVPTV
jgi:hypothetical protein